MNTIYKIEIDLFPNSENISAPFFWCLKSHCGKQWCVDSAGWEKTCEEAWVSAYTFYLKFKKQK